ncbi:MAG: hypothetical protein LQ348_002784 [Seirophora lacunosa]|nr:MAG: hypothetical protein LQ344_001176 [Seirophora lacunosa]KAI4193779.1 MAG: hypothetical protein LQ348_002784 [Seirophora lacunosa]
MSKKKRGREEDTHIQAPPAKKRATFIPDQQIVQGSASKLSFSSSGTQPMGIAVRGYSSAGTPSGNSINLPEKSGYQSLDLLEQVLLEPSKVYTPSSLPSGKTNSHPSSDEFNQYAKELPDLPVIQDLAIAEAPFTHQGVLKAAASGRRGGSLNYERLEFLGDAYLELIASRVILPRFPHFDPGKLSQTRQLLVCNETLADFSHRYGFHKRAHLPVDIRRRQDTQDKAWIKVMGDIFEAYVAALIVSNPENGFSIAEKWLAELWEPLLLTGVNVEVADTSAKELLSTKIMTTGTKIRYHDAGPPEKSKTIKGQSIFHVKIYYTGLGFEDVCLGGGKGSNKAEAGHNAARNAMHNSHLNSIMAKKKEFDSKAKAEKEELMATWKRR